MQENGIMKWYRIHLTNEQVIEGVHYEIKKQFTARWLKNGASEEVAMFDDFGMGTEGMNLYFSPGSGKFMKDIISQYSGEEATRPEFSEVTLLVGNDNAWDLFK